MNTDKTTTVAGGLTGIGALGLALEAWKGCLSCVPPVPHDYFHAAVYVVIGLGLLALGYFSNKP